MTVSQQGRPQEAAEAAGAALLVGAAKFVRAENRERAHPRARWPRCCARARVDRGSFFEDLGANSLLMARFCAMIRKNPGMSDVSMRDIYINPTIARLAAHLDSGRSTGFVADQARTVPRSVQPRLLHLRRAAGRVLRRLCAVRPLGARDRLSMDRRGRSRRSRSTSRSVALRGGFVRRPDRHLDRRQVAADRPVQGRSDPDLELRLFPLLGRQDA